MKIKRKNARKLRYPYKIPVVGRLLMALVLIISPILFVIYVCKEYGDEYTDEVKDLIEYMLLPWEKGDE